MTTRQILAGGVMLSALVAACAASRDLPTVASYEAAQVACIQRASALDASAGERKHVADTCRCVVKEQWGRSCDGGTP